MVIRHAQYVRFTSPEPNDSFRRRTNLPLFVYLEDGTIVFLSAWDVDPAAKHCSLQTVAHWDFRCYAPNDDLPASVKETLGVGPDYGTELEGCLNTATGEGFLQAAPVVAVSLAV